MLPPDLVSSATLRYLGTSAQKARLVVNLIRGKDVGEASATLRYTKKAVATDIGRLLDSAVANARQKRQDLDVDRLYVHTAFVDGGPMLKRIQPAPMGRAFRILKRMCHITLGLGERRAAGPAKAVARAAKAETAAAVGGTKTSETRSRRPRAGAKPKKTTKSKSGGRRGGAAGTKDKS